MQIGFTGTQQGMSDKQKVTVASLLDVLTSADGGHVHHGDCIGADSEFHSLAQERGLRIEIHPPVNSSKRAFCKGDIEWPEYDYRARNQHIVNCADVLIATPALEHETQRSGTWMTIRMARRKGIPLLIVYPSGIISTHDAERLLSGRT